MAPNGKPIAVPRSHGFHDRPQSSRSIHGLPTGMTSTGLRRRWAADPQRLADGEEADRDDDDVDAVGELRDAEGEPLLARWSCRCR